METNNEAMNRTYKERQRFPGVFSSATPPTLETVMGMLNDPKVQRTAAEAELWEVIRDVPTKTLRSITRVLRLCELPKE